jgi:hypothetical protein
MITGIRDTKTIFGLLIVDLPSYAPGFTIRIFDNFGNTNKTVSLELSYFDGEILGFGFCVVSDPLDEELNLGKVHLPDDVLYNVEISDNTQIIWRDILKLTDSGFVQSL